jgi:multimeric flavodoxin WrbA
MPQLLIVSHCPSENTRKLRDAALAGAKHPEITGVDCLSLAASEAAPEDVLACDALILGSTENFGYMAGLIKDFFERIYYPCLEETQGLPYALYIKAGNDGQGAKSSIGRIVTGLKWREVQPPLVMSGDFSADFTHSCEELGMTMAAGLESAIF